MMGMQRQADIVVTNEMVQMIYPLSKFDGVFKRLVWNGEQATGIFERGSRFNLTLTKVIDSDSYIVAVPNFFACMETENPRSCRYKINEHDVSAFDAESIEVAVRYMKQVMDEYRENEAKDARSQLVIANSHLEKALHIITEANQTGTQMDYVSHPNLSNTFDNVISKVNRINKIMYQKN
jgi:hypothetical protein